MFVSGFARQNQKPSSRSRRQPHFWQSCVRVLCILHERGDFFSSELSRSANRFFFVHYSIIATMCNYIIVFAKAFSYKEQLKENRNEKIDSMC